jgi:hypothetical protein
MSTFKKELITPIKARKWLEKRAENRPVSLSYVKELADSIKHGDWELNGETIKFNSDGELIDGQHRLEAVVLADKPILSYVCRGLDSQSFDTIDIGRRRDMSSILAKHGEVNYKILAGAISWAWRYDKANIQYGRSNSPRIQEGVAFLSQNAGLRECCSLVKCKLMSRGMAAALDYILIRAGKDRSLVDSFFLKLADGEGLSKSDRTSAILLLRNNLAGSKKATAVRLQPQYVWAISLKAFLAFEEGRVVKHLRFDLNKDKFPYLDEGIDS